MRLCERRGLLEEGNPDPLHEQEPLLAMLTAAAVQGTVATGDRAGQRLRRRLDPEEGVRTAELCYASRGVSLHAATRIGAQDRAHLEHLCRKDRAAVSVIRPPLAAGKLQILDPETLAFAL